MAILSFIVVMFICSFDRINAASSCYSCNPCGTTWNAAAGTVIQTSTVNDYCRKTVTGTLVVKDAVSSCNPVNILNNGVYCCQADLCNAAQRYSLNSTMLAMWICYSLWKIYSYYLW